MYIRNLRFPLVSLVMLASTLLFANHALMAQDAEDAFEVI